jgi:hypothetical protein
VSAALTATPTASAVEPACGCSPERPPHACWAEAWLCRFAATSWRSYGRYILPALEADDFAPGLWRRAFEALKARRPLPDDLEARVLSYWSVPGTEPRSSDIPQMIAELKDTAARRRLVWAAATIAEGAWRTSRPFAAQDAARILLSAVRKPERLQAAA